MAGSTSTQSEKTNPHEVPQAVGPDRSQCPPDEKVRTFADGKLSDASLEMHIRQCEWCAREYRDHARDLEWNRFIRRSTWALSLVVLAIIIFEALRSSRLFHYPRSGCIHEVDPESTHLYISS